MIKRQENIEKENFIGVGEYGIPEIALEKYDGCEWVGFNYALSDKKPDGKGIHFFLDDYQFNRLWNQPERYLECLRKYKYVLSPDFSLYTDFPKALQIYNHFRKHWLAAYWQENDIRVIPTICWSDESSFKWCFDGEPERSVVAVSSVGTQNSRKTKMAFLRGYDAMMRKLQPETVIFYGNVPEECGGNIVRIKAFSERFKEIE